MELDAVEYRVGPNTYPHWAIFHIWLDHPLKGLIFESIPNGEGRRGECLILAHGRDIVWAVIDSGIDADHPHFRKNKNLQLPNGIAHRDFTAPSGRPSSRSSTSSATGRTSRASSPANCTRAGRDHLRCRAPSRRNRRRHSMSSSRSSRSPESRPSATIVSLRVIGRAGGSGTVSNIIAALEYIDRINNHGRPPLKIHGVNLSVGNDYDPEWFACGESPLCDGEPAGAIGGGGRGRGRELRVRRYRPQVRLAGQSRRPWA